VCVCVCARVYMCKPVFTCDTDQYMHDRKKFVDWPNTAADGGKIEDEVVVEVLALLHVKAYHFHNTQQGCAHW